MLPYARRQQILQLLDEKDFVTVEQIVSSMEGVSESTVRRDMKAMADEGLLNLLRGGASKVTEGSQDTIIHSRLSLNTDAKEKIARYAASLVRDGEVIYLDAGSTPLRMVKYVRDKSIKIVTTNLLIFQEMAGARAECIVVGGEVLLDTGSAVGALTVSTLEDMYFDRAFLGITGFSQQSGVSTPSLQEAQKKKVVKNNSRHTYVLADSSKSGKVTMCKVFDLSEVTIICEKDLDILKDFKNYYIAE
ncbi:MAG: DeoR/GlpR transcriptional regulator [Blautia sp.]|nr:DeoR/GlpR transcriptional regulator [Blautia sp.]